MDAHYPISGQRGYVGLWEPGKNLLFHGRYALSAPGGFIHSTLIRLPGYPLLLAACSHIFGTENYFASACVQIALDSAACLLLADFAHRVALPTCKRSAALPTLWLAALWPFTAQYAAVPLAEGPSIFRIALAALVPAHFHISPQAAAVDSGQRSSQFAFPWKVSFPSGEGPPWSNALCFAFAVTRASFLRPDGALVAVTFAPAMVFGWPRGQAAEAIPPRNCCACPWSAFCWRWLPLPSGRGATGGSSMSSSPWRRV